MGRKINKKLLCPICDYEATIICSGCESVGYCNAEHQRAHLKVHELSCKPCKEERDAHTGKLHFLACQNFKSGDIILQEDPLLMGVDKQFGKLKAERICIGCCCTFGAKDKSCCPYCNWPMCGKKKCWAEGSQHSMGECALIKAAGSRVTEDDTKSATTEVHYGIMVLRCLSLRERDLSKWKELMGLKLPKSAFKEKGLDAVDEKTVVQLVKRWLPSANISKDTIFKLCRIFFIHGWGLQEIPGHRSKGIRGIYTQANLIEHSCIANATSTFTTDGQLVVRATVSIPKGTKISLNRISEPLWSTQKRRLYLATKFIDCQCERCKDPKEFGSFANGIYCPKCPNQRGILLSENPLKEDSDWICNKCSSRQTVSDGYVAKLLVKVSKGFQGLNRRSVTECEGFIRNHSKTLHPHHSYLTEVKMVLCNIYGRSEEDDCVFFSEFLLKKKEALAKELLKIVDIVAPGSSHLRGTLLYHIYSVMSTRIEKLKATDYDIPPAQLISQIKAVQKVLDELITIFSFESEETEEGRLCEQLRIKAVLAARSLEVLDMDDSDDEDDGFWPFCFH